MTYSSFSRRGTPHGKRLKTTSEVAFSFATGQHSVAWSSCLWHDMCNAYSFETPIARKHGPLLNHTSYLLLDANYKNYSTRTSEHFRLIQHYHQGEFFTKRKMLWVYDLERPTKDAAINLHIRDLENFLVNACNTRLRMPSRVRYLTYAEEAMATINTVMDNFDTFESLCRPTTLGLLHNYNILFQHSRDSATNKPERVEALIKLRAIAALES